MKARRWTDEELQEVKAKRVRGGVAMTTTGQGVRLKTGGEGPNQSGLSNVRASAASGVAGKAPSPKSPYKSKLELAWAFRLEVMKRNGEIDGWIYEPFTFKLAEGKRYRVDFLAWCRYAVECPENTSVEVPVVIAYECKGWHKNYRDSLTHLKWAAQRFPFFQWKKVVRNGKSGFEVYDVVV